MNKFTKHGEITFLVLRPAKMLPPWSLAVPRDQWSLALGRARSLRVAPRSATPALGRRLLQLVGGPSVSAALVLVRLASAASRTAGVRRRLPVPGDLGS